MLSLFRAQRRQAVVLLRAASSIGLVLLFSACATWFRPVERNRGGVEVFCGIEGPESPEIVVAVYVEDAVENATFIVVPVVNGIPVSQQAGPPRENVSIPAKTATCIRVPLPSSSADVRSYDVSVFGYSGRERVNGGKVNCEPKPVTTWDCEIR